MGLLRLPGLAQLPGLIAPAVDTRVFLIRDDFIKDRAAGAVDGTPASHKGTRAVPVDTLNGLSLSGGKITATANATGDPLFYIDNAITRAAGVGLFFLKFNSSNYDYVGWNTDKVSVPLDGSFAKRNNTILDFRIGATLVTVGTVANSTDYSIVLIARSTGAFALIKGGTFADWTLVWVNTSLTDATLYAGIAWRIGLMSTDSLRVAQLAGPWNNVDDYGPATNAAIFTGANGTALSALANARGGVFVHDPGIWDVQGNAARGSPTAGAELVVNGDFAAWTGDDPDDWPLHVPEDANNYVAENPAGECQFVSDASIVFGIKQAALTVDTWILATLDVTTQALGSVKLQSDLAAASLFLVAGTVGSYVATTRAASTTLYIFRTVACDVTIDNITVKPLPLSELFATVDDSDLSSCHVIVTIEALLAGTQAGFVMCLDDASNPQNFILGYHDGTKAWLEKCVGGVWTTLISETVAYVAEKRAYGIKDGSSVTLFYNEVKIGTTQTVGDAGIVDNTIHGPFSTHADNRLDKFEVHPYNLTGEAAAELTRYAS